MGWKNSFGQLIGIVLGVTVGVFAVNIALGGNRRQENPENYQRFAENKKIGVIDQAVANISNNHSSQIV